MSRLLHWSILVCVFVVGTVPAQAQTPDRNQAAELAGKIDRVLAKRWAEQKVTPAPLATDAEFLRRVYLDLAGRIPSVAETRSFLADKQADRRARVIDRLLASPRYSSHFASVYRDLFIPEASNNFIVRFMQGSFESWLRKKLSDNVGYDRMTRELLTVPIGNNLNDLDFLTGGQSSAMAFYAAKEYKAESLAAGTARIFLGVRVECAQCHNHPFADWKREEFWSMAAFFSGIQAKRQNDILIADGEVKDKREITIPGTEKIIQARFLDGTKPDWDTSGSSRNTLAEWITAPANPYFSRATVNRTWAYFLGTGLIEPIDEMVGVSSVSSHPELLDLLTREFAEQKFDLKFLIRAIVLTEAYQRSSAGQRGDKGHTTATPFARMPLRGLTPEQLFDSLAMATGFRDSGESSLFGEVLGRRSPRSEFLAKFANQTERATMAQTSILQALSLMNGKVVADATSLERSETLAALIDAPFLSNRDRIETLYLSALSRLPSTREIERANRFIDDAIREAGPPDSPAARTAHNSAVADLFWALLNSSEFVLNH